MNRSRITAAIVLAAATTAFVTIAAHAAGASAFRAEPDLATSPRPDAAAYAPGQLLVKFRAGVARVERATVLHHAGASVAGSVRDLGVHLVHVPVGAEQRVADALLRSGKVVFAERDGIAAATKVPNDPYWSQQWGAAKVNAPTAWDSTTGAASVVVADLDSGVTFSQPDLQGRLVAGYDFINNDADPTDDNGHGTETAGIIGAAANNGTGVAGMCWSCSIMPVKVLDSTAYGAWSAIANGITWATDHGAKVINMSLGGTSGSSTLQSAVQYAESHDVLVVAAAGNNASTAPFYPAYYSGVLSVAGTQSTDALYSWSDYGSWVRVAAPGCDYTTNRSGGYGSFCGTSAATPVVAGLAGLARAFNPSATATQVKSAIETSATNIGTAVAFGRVDAAGTLAALGGTPAPAPSETPSPTPTPSPSSSPSPTTTTTTFSGSLTAKATSRSYSVSSSAGKLTLSLTFNKSTSLTLALKSGSQTVLTTSGASPLPASVTVSAGSYTLTVSGSTRSSFTLSVTAPTA